MVAAPPGSDLRLRPVTVDDESVLRALADELATEGIAFFLDYDPTESWSAFVDRLERRRRGLDRHTGLVPATFLVAEVDGQIVGRTSIRHELNEHWQAAGHVGIVVAPGARCRGYAVEILGQSVEYARDMGISPVVLGYDEGNEVSAKLVARCGGVFTSVIERPGRPPRLRHVIH